jgi:hypothetical protein
VFRWVRRPLQAYGWPIVSALAIFTLVLGTWGFRLHPATQDGSVADSLYASIQLFTLQPQAAPPLPWQLELARWLAVVVAVGATVGALLVILRDHLSWIRARSARGHVLICGLGRCGARLALAFRDRGIRVVAIEKSLAVPGVEAARRAGVIVLPGDAAEPTILRRAGLHRARTLMAICGDDGMNVDVVANAHELIRPDRPRPLSCFAHVVDADVRRFLREFAVRTPKAPVFRLTPFDVSELGAPGILVDHPPFDADGRTELGPPHVLVVGLGQTGMRLILGVAQLWATTSVGSERPLRVTAIDRGAEVAVASLLARSPRLRTLLSLEALNEDVDSPLFAEHLAGIQDATGVYVCLDEELRGLRTALILRRALRDPAVPIIVRTTERTTLSTFPTGLQSSQVNVRIFRMLDRVCTPEIIVQGTNEVLARAIHEEYLRTERARGVDPSANPSMVEWDALPEVLKDSCRDQAAHTGSKLRQIGCDIVGLAELDESPQVDLSPAEIERLAELEHDRWRRERVAAGWRLGPQKDLDRKRTPYLVPWDELPEESKQRDRNMVRRLPAFLAKAGFAVIRMEDRGSEEPEDGSRPMLPPNVPAAERDGSGSSR